MSTWVSCARSLLRMVERAGDIAHLLAVERPAAEPAAAVGAVAVVAAEEPAPDSEPAAGVAASIAIVLISAHQRKS